VYCLGSSVSLGSDLLCIYDDARRRNLVDDVATCDADCEMLAAEERGADSVGPTGSSDRTAAAVPRAGGGGLLEADERPSSKRPLSVSSTSSSMSSTSSLPRHERKKLATPPGVEDAAAPPCAGDDDAGCCLSTVAELAPAAASPDARRRLSADDGRPPAPLSADDDAGSGGRARTLSRSQYVDRVVAEIIDTERAYVDDLDQIIHVRTDSSMIGAVLAGYLDLYPPYIYPEHVLGRREHGNVSRDWTYRRNHLV